MSTNRAEWSTVRGAVLLAGDERDLPELLEIVAELPADALTTVLIEVFAAAQISDFGVPGDIRVTWLVRSDAGHDRDARPRGARLGAAVHAWCAEWACSTDGVPPRCTVWLAAGTPSRIARMAQALIHP